MAIPVQRNEQEIGIVVGKQLLGRAFVDLSIYLLPAKEKQVGGYR